MVCGNVLGVNSVWAKRKACHCILKKSKYMYSSSKYNICATLRWIVFWCRFLYVVVVSIINLLFLVAELFDS